MRPLLFIDIKDFKEIQKRFTDIVNQLEQFNENAKNRLEAMKDDGYKEEEINNIIDILFGE